MNTTDRPDVRPPVNGHVPAGLTIDQAATALGLSREAVRHRVRRGTLAGERVNGQWRVHIDRTRPARRPADERPGEQAGASREIARLEELVSVLKTESGQLRGELAWFHDRLEAAEAERAELRRLLAQAQNAQSARTIGPPTGDPPTPSPTTEAPAAPRRRSWWAAWRRG